MSTNFFFVALSFLLFSCKEDTVKPNDSVKKIDFDCAGVNCEELIVPSDPYQVNPDFYGYADPSIRKELTSNTIWLAYSFPHYKMSGTTPVPSVSIHLSKSTDNGNTWTFVKQLFEPTPIDNPANPGEAGFLDHETVNLLPVDQNGELYWLAARLNYFIPAGGGFRERPNNSFHISIAKAGRPENLTTAETGTIGGSMTHSNWNVNQVLIPPALTTEAFFWNEPALYFDEASGKLYLVMVAFVYRGSSPVMAKNNTFVYSTTPSGNPSTWNWEYNGILADADVAAELDGQRISQTDIANGADGKLLLILTPDDWNATRNDFNHKGCKVIEIKSLENPELERDTKGQLKVRAYITASDANDLGSGASAYDAASETGILFTKRNKTTSSFTASIHKTGLRP